MAAFWKLSVCSKWKEWSICSHANESKAKEFLFRLRAAFPSGYLPGDCMLEVGRAKANVEGSAPTSPTQTLHTLGESKWCSD